MCPTHQEENMEPIIIEIPSKHWKPRTHPVDLLVVHAMGEWVIDDLGEYHYCSDWLNILKLSVHAFCLPDGRILQSVSPDHVAFHAKEFNPHSVGMEFIIAGAHTYQTFLQRIADVNHPPFTPAQYLSGGWWFRQQAQRFHLTFQHIKSHKELAPHRKEDPGAAFNWKTFQAAFEIHL